MSYDTKQDGGMDLFEFLYEAWKEKWPALALIAFFLAGGFISVIMDQQRHEQSIYLDEQLNSQVAYFSIRSSYSDVLERIQSEVYRDFFDQVIERYSLFKVEADEIESNELLSWGRDEAEYFGSIDGSLQVAFSATYGQILVETNNGNIDLGTDFFRGLQTAGRDQVTAERERVALLATAVRQILSEVPLPIDVNNDADSSVVEALPDWAAMPLLIEQLYATDPKLANENASIVDVALVKVEETLRGPRPISSRLTPTKAFLVWGILGGLAAVVFVMFRISIKRGSAKM